jgi:hypothetical protein
MTTEPVRSSARRTDDSAGKVRDVSTNTDGGTFACAFRLDPRQARRRG